MSELTEGAAAKLAEFEQNKDPESLRAASRLLGQVGLAKEPDPLKRLQLRRQTLELWLKLLAAIDQHLDPSFNPQDLPSVGVSPPESGGESLPSGADPSLIANPQARQQYVRAIQQNKEKAQRYRLQTSLRRLDQRLTPIAERFVRLSYTTVPGDQREAGETVRKLIKNPQRSDALTRAAAPKQ
ncbi:MAG: hypothetical protein ACLQGV_03285 [Bryobacteraceae bacterium]